MITGRFKVVRSFYHAGEALEVGRVIELSDNEMICALSAAGRIAPADDATARRLQRAGAAWSKPASVDDHRTGFVTHGSRNK